MNVEPKETRIAILEDGLLAELYVERPDQQRMVGDIYKGRITSILSGLRAAFVDIGLDRNAFLPMADVSDELLDYEDVLDADEMEEDLVHPLDQRAECLKVGQEILVQIAKEPMGSKGPRVTSFITIPGRYLVLMPNVNHIGISRRIDDREERQRLRKLVAGFRPKQYGVIVRTEAEGGTQRSLKTDMKALVKTWERICRAAEKRKPPALIHKDMGLVIRLIRDLFASTTSSLLVDNKEEYKKIQSYLKSVSPRLCSKTKWYEGDVPLFDAMGVESQIEKIFNRKVYFKSGGYLVIDQTEAMITIDVNTGRYSRQKDAGKMILETNLEASREIARQLRLRDIGGIIVIDFIDMETDEHKRKVVQELKKALKRDRSRSKLSRISELGLLQMTRKRVRPSLIHTFCEACPSCHGTGRVLSKHSLAMKLERWLRRAGPSLTNQSIQVRVHPSVADYVSIERVNALSNLSRQYRLGIDIVGDFSISVGYFDVYELERNERITDRFKA